MTPKTHPRSLTRTPLTKQEKDQLTKLASHLDPIHCAWDEQKKGTECPFFTLKKPEVKLKVCCWYCPEKVTCVGRGLELFLTLRECMLDETRKYWCGTVYSEVATRFIRART